MLTPTEINALIVWVRLNRDHIGDNADDLIKALDLAREYQCRRMTGQPVKFGEAQGVGVGPEAVVKVEDLRDGL